MTFTRTRPDFVRGGFQFLVLALLAVALVGCAPPAPTRQFVEQASRLHNEALAPAVVRQGDLPEYVQAVAQRLMEGAHAAEPQRTRATFFSQLQTHLVTSRIPNVFVTGGTHVYVYSGLLRAAESEEELAAAIAHALAHVIALDVQKTGLRPDARRPLRLVAYDFVENRFSLAQERAAHQLAFRIYVRAGYDPEKFENIFSELADAYPAAVADRVPLRERARSARHFAANADQKWRRPTVADRSTFAKLKREAMALPAAAEGADAALFLRAFPNCVLSADLPEQIAAQEQLRPIVPRRVELEPN